MNRLTLFILLVGVALAGVPEATAQPVTTLYSFVRGPINPHAGLTLGPDGSFYGTTKGGGRNLGGTVFRLTTNGALTTLHSFGGYADGSGPTADLTLGPDGNFYGTTMAGGTTLTGNNTTGVVFKMNTNGVLTTLVNFNGTNGGHPDAAVTLGPDGYYYGTTEFSGSNDVGTVFKVTTNGTLTTLVTFNNTNGANPVSCLTLAPGGTFYGTTKSGGKFGWGTAFKLTTNGDFTMLNNFDQTNGAWPEGRMALGPDGNLYGTAGTAFEMTTNGVVTTLVDSLASNSGLTLGPDGNFYGTTSQGGANGTGTIFQVSTNGILAVLGRLPGIQFQYVTNSQGFVLVYYSTNNFATTTLAGTTRTLSMNGVLTFLYSFSALVNSDNGDGADPESDLTLGPDGNFYGTTAGGGTNGAGAVFKISTNGTFTALASFAGDMGYNPYAGVTAGPGGSLYGVVKSGGTTGYGTAYKVTAAGQFTLLNNFSYSTDGATPQATLIQGPDGNFYGTAAGGGTNLLQTGPNSYQAESFGTVFKLATNGVLTVLAYFNGTNGANPYGGLALGLDGNFYGTTEAGGISSNGVVFRLLTNGTLTALTNFTGANGAHPYEGLTLGPDNNFYGTTEAGGSNNDGTVFQVTPAGALKTLVYFNGTNGANPNAGLMVGRDGNLYGTTYSGGTGNYGTVFKVTTGGAFTTLYSFTQTNFGYPHGIEPVGGLAQGPDGYLYGTTPLGGVNSFQGTLFKITTNGTLTTLYSFAIPNGSAPFATLTLQTNSHFINFYGTTDGDGGDHPGTVFRVNLTTSYAIAENTSATFSPLTNEVVWTTGGVLGLLTAVATNGSAQISGSGIGFTPATNFAGTATISYTVTDNDNAGGTNVSFITILVTNIPPVANPDFYAVAENSGANVLGPLANDLPGTSGGVLGLVSVSPTNGTAAISGTNVLFTPKANFAGTATIGYTITDNVGGTNSSLITIQVTNAAPVANLQSVTNKENVAQNITLTGSDPNHLPLTFTIVSEPGNGTLSGLDTNTGAVTYTPHTNYIGPDSFTFLVNNGQNSSAPATVSITVMANVVSNTPPLANPDYFGVAENTTNTFSPLVNDVVQMTGGTLGLVSLNPTNGTAVISGTNVVFTPYLNFLGTATIGYTITDNVGGTNSSLITVTVTNSTSIAIILPTAGQVVSNAAFTVTGTAGSLAAVTNVYVQLNNGSWTNATSANGWTNWTANVTLAPGSNTVFAYALDTYGNPSATNLVTFDYVPTVLSQADVSLTASAAPEPVGVGSNLVYSLTVSNAPLPVASVRSRFLLAAATGVTISNRLPAGVTFVSATGGVTPTNGLLLINLGSLANGATNGAQIIVRPGAAGRLTNVFAVFADQADLAPADNSVTVVSTVTNVMTPRPLTVTITSPVANQRVSNATFTVTGTASIGNAQPAIRPKLQPIDALTNVYVQLNTGGWSSATPVNGWTNWSATVTLTPGSNTVRAYARDDYGSVSPTNSVTFDYVPAVDVALSIVAAPNPVTVGAPLTYSLTVTNNSSTTATRVVVSNTLPPNVTFVSALPSEGSATNKAGLVTYFVGNLSNGDAATLAIVVLPNAAGRLTNKATAFSAQTDSQPSNNRVTNITTAVSAVATNLSVSVISPITLNLQTGLFEERVRVVNGGPGTASWVRVLVAGLASNAHLWNATGTTNGLPYLQSNASLGVGASVDLLLKYYVPTRVMPRNLVLTVQGGSSVARPATGSVTSSKPKIQSDGRAQFEFSTVPDQIYAVQYSRDLKTWRTALPALRAATNSVQWMDAGPPMTDSNPNQQRARYYRIILLPAN